MGLDQTCCKIHPAGLLNLSSHSTQLPRTQQGFLIVPHNRYITHAGAQLASQNRGWVCDIQTEFNPIIMTDIQKHLRGIKFVPQAVSVTKREAVK